MKLEIQNQEKKFQPVRLVFTCETQQDLDVFGGLSNSRMAGQIVAHAFPGWECPFDFEEFKELGVDVNKATQKIHDATYAVADKFRRIKANDLSPRFS